MELKDIPFSNGVIMEWLTLCDEECKRAFAVINEPTYKYNKTDKDKELDTGVTGRLRKSWFRCGIKM
jgi:hypothetical protein